MRYLIVGLGVALVIAAGVAWFLVPVRYEAYALLKVNSNPQTVLVRSAGNTPEFKIFKRTQVEMILSSQVLQRAVSDPEINKLSIMRKHNDAPAAWLKEQLEIEYPGDAEILRVALKAPEATEAKKIVDAVVNMYLKEVVQHERDLRNEHERKLELNYESYVSNVKAQSDVLHKLQTVYKSDNSEESNVRHWLEKEILRELMAERADLSGKIRDNSTAIRLEEVRAETPPETRTADPEVAAPAAADAGLSLTLLHAKQEHLQEQLKIVSEQIAEQAKALANLDDSNVNVQSKQAELQAVKRITDELRDELGRLKLERLAPERITKVDDAVLAGDSGDATRKYTALGTLAALGLGLVALGLMERRPRG